MKWFLWIDVLSTLALGNWRHICCNGRNLRHISRNGAIVQLERFRIVNVMYSDIRILLSEHQDEIIISSYLFVNMFILKCQIFFIVRIVKNVSGKSISVTLWIIWALSNVSTSFFKRGYSTYSSCEASVTLKMAHKQAEFNLNIWTSGNFYLLMILSCPFCVRACVWSTEWRHSSLVSSKTPWKMVLIDFTWISNQLVLK